VPLKSPFLLLRLKLQGIVNTLHHVVYRRLTGQLAADSPVVSRTTDLSHWCAASVCNLGCRTIGDFVQVGDANGRSARGAVATARVPALVLHAGGADLSPARR